MYNGEEYKNWKRKYTTNYIEYIYNLIDQKKPVVIIANSLIQYRIFYHMLFNSQKYNRYVNNIWNLKNKQNNELDNELHNELDNELRKPVKYHYLFLCSEYTRVYLMWYKFIKDEFKVNTIKSKELDYLYENINNANISKGFLMKKLF